MVLLVLGSAVLAGPAIRAERRLNRSEENAVESSSVTQETSSSAVTEAAALNEVSETSTAAQPITAGHSTTITAEQTTTVAPMPTSKPRKTITFDQRQEGKFNIRADLENFVIVVVPSSPSAGISLLDLLNRSGQKHQQKKKSGHRKNTKNHAQKKVSHATPEVVVLDESQSHARVANEEFIEGRTPYRVDISSTARSSNSEQPSPIYRVVRPFNFHVEQPTSSNMVHFPEPSGNYYPNTVRESKSLLGPAPYQDEIRTNTVYTILTTNNNNYGDGAIQDIEDDGTGGDEEVDDDGDDNYLMMEQRTYLDLPASSFDSLEYPRSDVDMMKLQLQGDNERVGGGDVGGEWELKLLGAQEQCGPDRKRDSYGVCQFVTP